ncbi:MAG: glutamate mutase L [Casimicrobiaceae bacterium]
MTLALLIDFGSTWTKLRALDLDSCALIAATQGPSTVTSDVNIGLDIALARLRDALGGLPTFAYHLASSSAAGGLRMITIGLVRELTAEAARQAALGAGAKLCGSFAYRLTAADVREVETLAPDIVLLCGGTDGGNRDVIVHNARALARSGTRCPVVVAGNRETTDEIVTLLSDGERLVIAAANVLPTIDTLDIDPARARIDHVLMPTPAAVLEGARLLADGIAGREGLGPLVVVDPGGATTDVHSIGTGEPGEPGVIRYGLPEPYAKRTVEGDLGMRHNAATIVAAVGLEALATDAGLAPGVVGNALLRIEANVGMLPATDIELQLDEALVRAAVDIAMKRHAGTVETVYTTQGRCRCSAGKISRPRGG